MPITVPPSGVYSAASSLPKSVGSSGHPSCPSEDQDLFPWYPKFPPQAAQCVRRGGECLTTILAAPEELHMLHQVEFCAASGSCIKETPSTVSLVCRVNNEGLAQRQRRQGSPPRRNCSTWGKYPGEYQRREEQKAPKGPCGSVWCPISGTMGRTWCHGFVRPGGACTMVFTGHIPVFMHSCFFSLLESFRWKGCFPNGQEALPGRQRDLRVTIRETKRPWSGRGHHV